MKMTQLDALVLQAMHGAPERQMDRADVVNFLFGPFWLGSSQSVFKSYNTVAKDALHRLACRGLIKHVQMETLYRVVDASSASEG
jgi:hypothetical protein